MVTNDELMEEFRYALGIHNLSLIDPRQLTPERAKQLASYQELADRFLQTVETRTGTHVRFAFTHPTKINGLAISRTLLGEECRFSTVTAGTVLAIHEFFSYIMSRSDILPGIGDPKGEKNDPAIVNLATDWPILGDAIRSGLLTDINPRDPLRKSFYERMAVASVSFVIYHEIAHSLSGHTVFRNFSLDEVQTSDQTVENAWLVQTLEMSSDAIATSWLCRSMLSSNAVVDLADETSIATRSYKTKVHAILLGFSLLFQLLAPRTNRKGLPNVIVSSHPPPAVRRWWLGIVVREIALELGTISVDPWLGQIFAKCTLEAQEIWTRLTGIDDELFWMFEAPRESIGASLKKVQAHMNILLTEWATIRPELEPFAMIPLPK